MISYFWSWITQSVQNGLSILENFVSNMTTGPFMDLLLVVILFAAMMHFLVIPLIGSSLSSGKSDKVKKKKEKTN